jgi:excisionase family DNA binding protein
MNTTKRKDETQMRAPAVIPQPRWKRNPPKTTKATQGKMNSTALKQTLDPINLQRHPRPHTHHKLSTRLSKHIRRAFTPLIDAKAASQLLGVPYTWLLAQARAGSIPHHRLGHYVRFDPDDLKAWLREERIGELESGRETPRA